MVYLPLRLSGLACVRRQSSFCLHLDPPYPVAAFQLAALAELHDGISALCVIVRVDVRLVAALTLAFRL